MPATAVPVTRPFHPRDTRACMAVFDSNLPPFFFVHERAEFLRYLQQPQRTQDYQVIACGDHVVASGGLEIDAGGTAANSRRRVEQARHRQGLGTALAQARIALAQGRGARRLTLSTSQHTQAFYAALGFTVTRVVRDGHGPGLDAVDMERALAPAQVGPARATGSGA